MFSLQHLFNTLKSQRALWRGRGPHNLAQGGSEGPTGPSLHSWKSSETLLSLHLRSWGRLAKQAPLTVNFLLMAFTIHDQAAQNQLTFPLGLLCGEAGAQMECKRWRRRGGAKPNEPGLFRKHSKPTPSRPHWSPIPPGQTPSPFCRGREAKGWTGPWRTVSAHCHHQHAPKGIRPTQLTSRCVPTTRTQSKRGQNEIVSSKVIHLNCNTTHLFYPKEL